MANKPISKWAIIPEELSERLEYAEKIDRFGFYSGKSTTECMHCTNKWAVFCGQGQICEDCLKERPEYRQLYCELKCNSMFPNIMTDSQKSPPSKLKKCLHCGLEVIPIEIRAFSELWCKECYFYITGTERRLNDQ